MICKVKGAFSLEILKLPMVSKPFLKITAGVKSIQLFWVKKF